MIIYDCVIIGGGVSGLTAALYLSRANKSVLVIDESMGGNLFYAKSVRNYPGVEFSINGSDIMANLSNQVTSNGVTIIYDQVIDAKSSNNKLVFRTISGDEFTGITCILATGTDHKELDCETLNSNIHYCALCDGGLYINKKVAVLGGGNSAFSNAIYLNSIGCEVSILHRSNKFKAFSAQIKQAEKLGIKIITDIHINKINNNILYTNDINYDFDAYFVCIGQKPNNTIAKLLNVNINYNDEYPIKNGYIITNSVMNKNPIFKLQTNINNVFACGSIIGYKYDQAIIAAGSGAECALDVNDYLNSI